MNFKHEFRRPFFDLEDPSVPSSTTTQGPILAYKALVGEEVCPLDLERVPGPNFRFNLMRAARAPHSSFLHPAEVPEAIRSSKWSTLIEHVEKFQSISTETKLKTCRLLSNLGFNKLIIDLVPHSVYEVTTDSGNAELAVARAMARHIAIVDCGRKFDPTEYTTVLDRHFASPKVRFHIGSLLMVHYSKYQPDIEKACRYREIAEDVLFKDFDSTLTPFLLANVVSRFYRGASLVPMLKKDYTTMTQELDIAENTANQIQTTSPSEKVIKEGSLSSCYETRMRESLLLRDLARAEHYVNAAHKLDPWDPKLHIEMGEVAVRGGCYQAAAGHYEKSLLFAPPGEVIAYFMVGHCWEKLRDFERATNAYVRLLEIDPDGVSSLAGLERCVKETGDVALLRMMKRRSAERAQKRDGVGTEVAHG